MQITVKLSFSVIDVAPEPTKAPELIHNTEELVDPASSNSTNLLNNSNNNDTSTTIVHDEEQYDLGDRISLELARSLLG